MINKKYILFIIFGLINIDINAMNTDQHGQVTGSVDPSTLSDEALEAKWQQLTRLAVRGGAEITAAVHGLGDDNEAADRRNRATAPVLHAASRAGRVVEQSIEPSGVFAWLRSNWKIIPIVIGAYALIKLFDGKKQPAQAAVPVTNIVFLPS